ncbi:MAG: glycosyltransferase family 39 protein, partial [Micavibrio aeruginosavorus]|nr:glycosyltransferase family 39 protein [Micavibrio aeruginosavorus]
MTPRFYPSLFVPLSFLGMFLAVVLLRPLLPIDETRYVTVAWEMFLRHDPLAPLTVNGTPYHHKPPLLFWLI